MKGGKYTRNIHRSLTSTIHTHQLGKSRVKVREGKQLILATKEFARDFTAESWWHVISTGVLLAFVTAGTLWNFHILGRVLCSILCGLLLVRMFVIYHDHQHHAILPKSRLAAALMKLYGLYALTPSSIWTSSHNYHHTHNSKLRGAYIGSFPIMTKKRYLEGSKAERARYLFMRSPFTIFFGYFFIFIFGMCIQPFVNNPRRHFDSIVALILHIAVGTLLVVFAGWAALFLTLVIPHFIGCASGSYLFYAQHNFPLVTLKDNAGWTYEGAALESSSFVKMNRVMLWFTGNIGCHHIHHLNSRIPFYRLPEVMRKMPELQTPKTTSLNPLEVIRCLRLKVWDVETQRMVRLSQF